MDLISRQDAIDAVAKILSDREGGNAVWWKPVAKSVIDVLPSAQPEIIRCKDCMWFVDNDPDNAQGMCDNEKGWVVATSYDFGCIYAERKDNG